VVTRALSGGEDPEVDVTEIRPVPSERYLLCSDGLFSVVTDDQIASIVGGRHATLDEVCQRLIETANGAGGPDNITALLLEVDAR
jgi:protein phosphatase